MDVDALELKCAGLAAQGTRYIVLLITDAEKLAQTYKLAQEVRVKAILLWLDNDQELLRGQIERLPEGKTE